MSLSFLGRWFKVHITELKVFHTKDQNMGYTSEKLKNIENLEHFKKEIKTWNPDNYPCRLCKVYIGNVGLLISLKLRTSCWNYCFLHLHYYRIYISYFTVILYMKTFVRLKIFYLLCFLYKIFYVQ